MSITVGSSTITVDSGAVMAAPTGTVGLFFCRIWVNFNGTGTVAIRGSGGVSSITDHAVGVYSVNFTTNMPDANYCTASGIGDTGAGAGMHGQFPYNGQSVSGFSMLVGDVTISATQDPVVVSLIFIR